MRSVRTVILALVAFTASVAAALASGIPQLRVSPGSGQARSSFTVHFTAPAASGSSHDSSHGYALTGAVGGRTTGCLKTVGLTPVATRAHQAMAVTLNPAKLGGQWCRGTYSGKVAEETRPICGAPVVARASAIACPQFILVATIGTFHFTVR